MHFAAKNVCINHAHGQSMTGRQAHRQRHECIRSRAHLHLHGLHDQERVALLDLLPWLNEDLQVQTRHIGRKAAVHVIVVSSGR